jgi:glycogen operon protein
MTSPATETQTQPLGTTHPAEGPFSPINPEEWSKAKYPLGAHIAARTATFAVHASAATRVLLELYAAPMGEEALHDYWMAKGSDGIWRA